MNNYLTRIMKTGLNNLTPDEINEANDALDPFSFEKYCMNCDNFPGDGLYEKREYNGRVCPFIEKFENGVFNGKTEWKQIGCQEFWD